MQPSTLYKQYDKLWPYSFHFTPLHYTVVFRQQYSMPVTHAFLLLKTNVLPSRWFGTFKTPLLAWILAFRRQPILGTAGTGTLLVAIRLFVSPSKMGNTASTRKESCRRTYSFFLRAEIRLVDSSVFLRGGRNSHFRRCHSPPRDPKHSKYSHMWVWPRLDQFYRNNLMMLQALIRPTPEEHSFPSCWRDHNRRIRINKRHSVSTLLQSNTLLLTISSSHTHTTITREEVTIWTCCLSLF